MGTYTTNYQLYMPSIGEQGWGDLVNGNFTTIDMIMKGLDTRIDALEPLSVIHVDENQNISFPGSVTAIGGFNLGSLGKITTETGVISGIILSNEVGFGSVTGGSGSTKSITFTYTYKTNPLCNDVTFTITVTVGNSWNTGSGNIKVNDTQILSYAFNTAHSSGSNSVTVTLNDGDVITGYLDAHSTYVTTSARMTCSGYLINA